MGTYTRTAFWGFLWIGLGSLLANIFAYLLRLLFARNLSVEEYGLVYAVIAMFGLISVFVYLGMGESLTRHTAAWTAKRLPKRIPGATIWVAIILYTSSFLIACIAIALSSWLAQSFFAAPLARNLVMIYAVVFFLSPIGVIIPAIYVGRNKMHLQAVYTLTQSALLLLVALVLIRYGPIGAVATYACTMVLMHVLFIPSLSRVVPKFWSGITLEKKTLSALVAYGIPVMFTGLASAILTYTDTNLLTLFSTLAEVGVYQAALPTANILLFLVGVVGLVLLPLVTDLWVKRQHALLTNALRDLYGYVFIGMLPLVIGAIVYPDLILNLLFGASYMWGARALQFLALSSLFLTLHAVSTSALSGIGKPIQTTKAIATGAVINLITNLLLIPKYGAAGAAFATSISSGAMLLLGIILLRNDVKVRLPFSRWIRTLCCGVAFWLVLWASHGVTLPVNQYLKVVLALVVASLAYAGALFLTRTITMAEIRDLLARVGRNA